MILGFWFGGFLTGMGVGMMVGIYINYLDK
jgi:hypothetical protein